MQPIRLRLAPHDHHIPVREGQLDRRRRNTLRSLVLHEEIALRAERQRRNAWIWAEEPLVVGAVGNTVVP